MTEIEKRSIRISALFTNGTLINDIFIEKISTLVSKFTVFVSLDSIPGVSFTFRGFSKEKSDAVLLKIINNIRLLVSSGVSVTINTVVNSENIDHLDEMYVLIKNLNIKSWRLGFPKQTSFFKNYTSKFNVEWDIIAGKCFTILENHLENKKPFDLQIEYLYRETLFNQGLHNLNNDDYVCDYEGRRGECCIKPNGDVVSCAYCNDTPVGNVKNNSLKKVWYSLNMQSIKKIRIGSVKECLDCDLKSVCGTGCRANAYFLHGDFYNAKDDYACKAVKFFTNEVYPLLIKYGYKN
jgi:radical SAM protein with 4Fe4S-binding SPASM domain